MMVGSGIEVFVVKTIFLEGLAYKGPVFMRKGETIQNRDTQISGFSRGRAVKVL
jgi:hypothetical protein